LVYSINRISFDAINLNFMFGLFKKKSEKETLLKKYKSLTEEAYKLSHSDRTASDKKTKEANDVLDEIKAIELKEKNHNT